MCVLVTQSCPTLCDPTDWGLTGSSIYVIFQTSILEWVAIPFSRGIFLTQGSNLGLPHCRHSLPSEPLIWAREGIDWWQRDQYKCVKERQIGGRLIPEGESQGLMTKTMEKVREKKEFRTCYMVTMSLADSEDISDGLSFWRVMRSLGAPSGASGKESACQCR